MAEQADSKVPQIRFKGFEGMWVEKTLGELTPLRGGFAFQSSQYRKAGIPIVKISNVLSTGNVGGVFAFYDEQANDQNYSLPNNSALLAMSGATTGKVSLLKIRNSEKVYQNQRVGYFEDLQIVDYPFISTLVRSNFFTQQLHSVLVAGAQPNVSSKEINSFDFRTPKNKAEQTQIGGYFKELDGMIGLHQRKHGKLVTLKQAMLQKMFPQNGATTPEIRFKGFSEPWVEKMLRELSSKVTEKNVLKSHSETFTNSAEFGVISQRDYFDKDITNSANIGSYYVVEPESFVYNPRISSLAPCGPVNRNRLGRTGVMSPIYTVFRTKDVDNTFLEYFFKTALWHPFMFLNGDTGARSDRFSIKDAVFVEMPVPYPQLEEQQKIGTYFRQLDSLITKHATQLEKLKQLKSACLEKMFV